MFDMLLWFAVVMVLFAVGDVVAKLTKARISSVFATLMLFLVLFVTGVLPADIIEKAGLSAASSWSVPMLLFAMGSMINLRQLRAGESFSELQLARAASVSPVVVREYLLKFGRYNLIQSEKRGQWSMKQFDQSYAEQLFELREMLETHSLQHFLNLPDDDPRWLQAKTMLERHRTLRDSIGSNFRMFSQLDRDFHAMLLSAADNIFFNQSLEIISVIFHFHYQWDESDLKQRNIIAVDEHMTILSALICRSDLDAITALRNHLDTAKQSMIRSIRQHHR